MVQGPGGGPYLHCTDIECEYATLPTGIGQTLKEGTFTTEFKVAKNLILRPEYRHDWSDQYSFDAGRYKTQDTLSIGAMYLF